MSSEDEIIEQLNEYSRELKSYGEEAHWFCPQRNNDDDVDYTTDKLGEGENITVEEKQQFVRDAKRRHNLAYKYALVLGFDAEHVSELLSQYRDKLQALLTTCDKCVYNWHLGRKAYLKELSEDFPEELVAELSNRLDALDFSRIDAGLAIAENIFAAADPQARTQALLAQHDPTALIALFESLCCVNFHSDNERLAKHFDFVFEQAQNKRVLRIQNMLPAMARFLYDSNPVRHKFATQAWLKMPGMLTPQTFEWVVHDVLGNAIPVVAAVHAAPEDIQRFWQGFTVMLEKMDKNLITHSLRGMEVQPDVYKLALQHLYAQSETLVALVIYGMRELLIKSSQDFWRAMESVSAATVMDQIFQSPGYDKLVQNRQTWYSFEDSIAVSWIPVLLRSLDSDHQYDACRKLLDTLFNKFQDVQKFNETARGACCRAGLESLHTTLETFTSTEYKINPSTSLIMISNIMGLVDRFRPAIIGCAELNLRNGSASDIELKKLGMKVIRDALALDCKAISAEFFALGNDTKVQRADRKDSRQMWVSVLDIFRPGNVQLVMSILPAIANLTGVDVILPANRREPQRMLPGQIAFNKDLLELFDNVSKVLERLSDFSTEDLHRLMHDQLTARTLIASLLSANQGISEASVEIIKVMTAQESRLDAYQHLLSSYLAETLVYMTAAIKKVGTSKTFGPMPYMIKTGRDILRGLCGNTGVLRSRSEFQSIHKNAIFGWWIAQWQALEVCFSCTEEWAPRVEQDTKYMENFLRECMEFAENLFDEHSIITSTLTNTNENSGSDSTKSNLEKAGNTKVLKVISSNINGLVRMIRLRDEYLISVTVRLMSKLLRTLGEYDLEASDYVSRYIRNAYKRDGDHGYLRTNLTAQQKAELQRALTENTGFEFIEVSKPVALKTQGRLDAWSKSADGEINEPKLPTKKVLPFAKPSSVAKHLEILKAKEAMSKQQQQEFMEKRRKQNEDTKRAKDAAIAKAKALRGPAALVQGEGSGIKNIGGVAGKDHAPQRSEIMVGSSDEDSDSDSDDDTGLFKVKKETSTTVSEYEASRRRAFLKAQEGPVKKTKIQRSAKDQRARVDPDMTKLYQQILSWDIFHEDDAPPGNNECRKIDNSYLDPDLYKRTFFPLLISEVWRSLVTSKDENNFKAVEIKILNRVNVDKFLEVSTTMPIANNKDLKMSERDIVLFSKSPDPLNNREAPHCLARVDRTTRKRDTLEITYKISRDVGPALISSFVPNGKVFALKICDLTTTQREFAALSSLEYYDLCTEVLEAKPSPLLKYSETKIAECSTRYNLNTGQAKAILSATDNDGFTLIQGPPGTGKTKTIVAMVGALMSDTLREQQADKARMRPPTNGQKPLAPKPKKKLLICAPSNAAVDELVVRLMDGIQPQSGPKQKINVIRIGRSDAVNVAVKDVILEELVRAEVEGNDTDKIKLLQANDELHKKAGATRDRLNVVRPLMEEAQSKGDTTQLNILRGEFDQLKRQQAQLGAKIDEQKDSGMTVSRQNEISRRKFQQKILDEAHVICSTLSGSGHDMFRNLDVEFETVIIDEAAQCIELSALIPLKYGASKCILVGDPEQLPPTVLSHSAQSFGYEQSLFVRMQKNHPKDVHLLDTQYRMHPEISRFPSAQFYNSRLIDGNEMAKLRQQPWHASTILGPYRFFDVAGVQTKQTQGHSFINVPEVNAALQLYQRLKIDYKDVDFKGKIGIIASYKAQLNELKSRFARQYTDAIFDEIEFNTTDAFQGREREIIIFSCVRAKASGGIGFLGDIRRMNVGLTRAKSSLWVLGDSRALSQGKFWSALIEDAKTRGRYTSENVMELFSRPTERLKGPIVPEAPLRPVERRMSTASVSGAERKPSIKQDDDADVVMLDTPPQVRPAAAAPRPRNLLGIAPGKTVVKAENRPPPTPVDFTKKEGTPSALGKHPRSTDSPELEEKTAPADSKKIDLDAALRAKEEAKKIGQSPGVKVGGEGDKRLIKKKKKVVDPFIQKKR